MFCGQQYYAHALISASECILVSQNACLGWGYLEFFQSAPSALLRGFQDFILLKLAVVLVQRRSSLLNLIVAIKFHGLKSSHLQCVKAVMG